MSFKLSTGNIAYPSASASVSANGDDTATIKVSASCYLGDGYVQSTGVVAKIYFWYDDQWNLKSTQTLLGNGTYYDASYGSKEVSDSEWFYKNKTPREISWAVDFHQYTDGNDQGLKETISGKTTISAMTSYVISYNASGGTNAPANQTKWYGETLTLTSSVPTKMYYTFKGWGTYPNTTEVVYTAGGSYTNNQEHVLYAVWEPNKYSITFDANGGTGAPAKIEYSYSPSGSFVLTSTKPTRTGYTFLGWSLDKNATEPEYYAGQTNWGYFNADDYVLYAVWRQNVLTVHYNSNYATEAFSGALSQVGEDKDVIVRTETFLYDTPYEYGLTNYTETNNNTYLARKGYTAAGYWATVNEIDVDWRSKLNGESFNFIRSGDDIAIWQDYIEFTGQDLAHMLGVALGDGDKTVNLYAQWYIKASRVTIYNDNNEPEDGLICIYTKDGSVRYGTITVYDANGNPRTVI